jgi:hypothetical protein
MSTLTSGGPSTLTGGRRSRDAVISSRQQQLKRGHQSQLSHGSKVGRRHENLCRACNASLACVGGITKHCKACGLWVLCCATVVIRVLLEMPQSCN